MKKLVLAVFAMAVVFLGLSNVSAQMSDDKMMKGDKMMKSDNPMVGGAAMYKTKTSLIMPSTRKIIRHWSLPSKPPVWLIH